MLNSIVIKLLNDNGKISLPTIGIFVKVDLEDDTAYIFTPSAVKTDARMIDAVMSEMDVPSEEAVNIITSYVEFIKNIISKNGKYPFKGIGDVMVNEQGIFYFVPSSCEQHTEVKIQHDITLVEVKPEQNIVVEPIIESIIAEPTVIRPEQDIINEIVQQRKIVDSVNDVVKEETRLNERSQPRRLGEIMEGGVNKRFYDKVHSQVAAKSIDDIVKESIVIEKAIEEAKEVVLEPEKTIEQEIPKYEPQITIEVQDQQQEEVRIPQVEPVQQVESTQPLQHELSQDTLRDMLGHSKRKGLYEVYDKGAYMEKSALKRTVEQQPVQQESVQQPPIIEQQQERVITSVSVEPTKVVHSFIEPEEQHKPKKKIDLVLYISIAVIVIGLCVIAYFYYMQQELGLGL